MLDDFFVNILHDSLQRKLLHTNSILLGHKRKNNISI